MNTTSSLEVSTERSMKYLGGKRQIAGRVEEQILARSVSRDRYVEPFVGGASIWTRLAPRFREAHGSDAHPDLVLYLNALRDGWVPPVEMPREEYDALRVAEPSALRGHVGFNYSFGGMWFRGWQGDLRDGKGRTRMEDGYRAALRDAPLLARCPPILRLDYRQVEVRPGDVVYCDPPYHATEEYDVGFCSYAFWAVASRWARLGATVVVSEETAPDDWVAVWSYARATMIGYDPRTGERNPSPRSERIFVHESQVTASDRTRHKPTGWPAIE
jgi:hypothetical protein